MKGDNFQAVPNNERVTDVESELLLILETPHDDPDRKAC